MGISDTAPVAGIHFVHARSMGNKIIILGAGFAGLQVARQLKKTSFDITLIDQYNFHQFQPLFYQVATVSTPKNRTV